MACKTLGEKRTSTLPPPCYHCRPSPFCCPKNGCPPLEPILPMPRCSPPCPQLVCRAKPKLPPPRPTLCIARPCPEPSGPKPYSWSPPSKLTPPPSHVKFCIRYTCQGPTYCPCYTSGIPTCNSVSNC